MFFNTITAIIGVALIIGIIVNITLIVKSDRQ